MSALFGFLNSGAAVGAAIGELLQYGWRFLKNLFQPKAVLAARVLGGGEPTSPLPGAVGKPRRTPSLFLRGLPLAVGPIGRLLGRLAEVYPAHAAGDGQAVA